MLERTQIYVDTSYLLASFYNSWNMGARAQLEIDLPEVVAVLGRMAGEHLKQPVHRQLWYDGIPEAGPHRYQRSLRSVPGVQLRAGQLIEWGDRRTQKAVDTRLVADMVITSMKDQVTDMILVSGDADMLPGVEEAVNNGVRVHLYGFGWDSMSSALRFACDSVTILDPREDFRDTMRLEIIDEPVIPEGADEAEALIADNFDTPADTEADRSATESSENDAPASSTEGTTQDSNDTPIEPTPAPVIEKPLGDAEEPEKPGPSPIPAPAQYAASTPKPSAEQKSTAVEQKPAEADQATADSAAPKPGPQTKPSPADLATPQKKSAQKSPAEKNSAETQASASHAPTPQAAQPEATEAPDTPAETEVAETSASRPNPGMMARHRKLRSRYVPLPSEVWAAAGSQNAFDIGEQYAVWWWDHCADESQIDEAHLLTGGGLPPKIDRPLLQFACDTLHEYTLTEAQRVGLRDGFHSGIRRILLKNQQN